MRESVLGPQAGRVKTDLRLPPEIVEGVEAICAALQIPKNAFFVLSAATFFTLVAPVLAQRPRARLVASIEKIFLELLEKIKDNHE